MTKRSPYWCLDQRAVVLPWTRAAGGRLGQGGVPGGKGVGPVLQTRRRLTAAARGRSARALEQRLAALPAGPGA